jgi:hypothetical protein
MAITKASSNAVAPAAKGDLVVGSATNDSGVLAVGANGTTLVADSAETTGLKWAAPSGANPSFSLLSTTTLSGAATRTITGLSGYNTFYMIIKNASGAATYSAICFRVNADTSNIYRGYGINMSPQASYSPSIITQNVQEDTKIGVAVMSGASGSSISGYVRLEGCNSSGIKMFVSGNAASDESNNGHASRVLGGFIDTSSVISSITIFTDDSSNFDGGTLRIYGSVA